MVAACTPAQKPIEYAKDPCQFCKMTIMEPGFASELVTKKGKVFKFDDLSCMIKYMKIEQTSIEDHAYVLVNMYGSNEFLNVQDAVFLHSESFKSPMRGDVAAFKGLPDHSNLPLETTEEIKPLNWAEIIKLF